VADVVQPPEMMARLSASRIEAARMVLMMDGSPRPGMVAVGHRAAAEHSITPAQ
jgi:hypothetical protein